MSGLEPSAERLALRALPSVDEVLGGEAIRALLGAHPREAVVRAVRAALDDARGAIREDPAAAASALAGIVRGVGRHLAADAGRGPRRVINGTGVVLHTNLGRAPLPRAALEAIAAHGAGYLDLEVDRWTGARGKRDAPLARLLLELCGAEAALAVNNNAGAVLLTLSALARGKECVISRGELVEIGGGFRIPEVMEHAGTTLVEVGTTNRTRVDDYAQAIGPSTGLLVKVLPSNFSIVGFHEEASIRQVASLARERGIPFYLDLGSGYLRRVDGMPSEPTVAEALEAGADVVSFSGDKLLGGPQVGFVVGRGALLTKMERHPLFRALRMDKLSIVAAEATLRLHRDRREGEIPAMSMLREGMDELKGRAEALARRLEERGISTSIRTVAGAVGGGAAPGASLPSVAVAVWGDALALQRELRRGEPSVFARVDDDVLLLDVRTIPPSEVEEVARAVERAKGNVEGVVV